MTFDSSSLYKENPFIMIFLSSAMHLHDSDTSQAQRDGTALERTSDAIDDGVYLLFWSVFLIEDET